MPTIVNLTPHSVNIIEEDGSIRKTYEPSGTIARATMTSVKLFELDGVEVNRSTFGAPIGLPELTRDTYYIVSLATAKAAQEYGRSTQDLLLTSSPVRDEKGAIIGCRGFAIL